METGKPLIIPPNLLSTCQKIQGKPCTALEWSQNGRQVPTCVAPDSCHCINRERLLIQPDSGDTTHTLRVHTNPLIHVVSGLWPF
ncbi:hypothetical protein GF362_00970 [Candidatus Dojkabacteria bacterium]|nr:hypothetical protein [Candidatus Dojkabacteria bacterium]